MSNVWDDIFAPNERLVRELLQAQFPTLSDTGPEYIGEGWDCVAYRLGDWVFRFPRRPLGLKTLATEARFLPQLGRPVLQGAPTESFPYLFLGTKHQPGKPLEECSGPRLKLASQLGSWLRDLHNQPIPDGLPPDNLSKLDPSKRGKQVQQHLGHLPEWLPTTAPSETNLVVTHGDLYCRHVYVDEQGQLAGIIDWGDLHHGHRAVDLACAWSLFEDSDRSEFWRTYGTVDDETLNWARFRALYHTLLVKDYAAKMGFERLLKETTLGLMRVLGGHDGSRFSGYGERPRL